MNILIASKKFTGLTALALALAVSAVAPASHALGQTTRVSAKIPFDFQNGSDHLQAGSYVIGMDTSHMISLRGNKTTSMSLSRIEINNEPVATGKLVFRKYGSRYFLREVWLADKSEHLVVPKSKAEKRQQNALNVTERDGTEVALLEPFK